MAQIWHVLFFLCKPNPLNCCITNCRNKSWSFILQDLGTHEGRVLDRVESLEGLQLGRLHGNSALAQRSTASNKHSQKDLTQNPAVFPWFVAWFSVTIPKLHNMIIIYQFGEPFEKMPCYSPTKRVTFLTSEKHLNSHQFNIRDLKN